MFRITTPLQHINTSTIRLLKVKHLVIFRLVILEETHYLSPSVARNHLHAYSERREREMFYLTTHSTHFIYGYMASDIWLRTILIMRKETRCRHIGYSYRLAARVLLYAPSHRQDNTYHGLCYTSRGALAGTRNSSMGAYSERQVSTDKSRIRDRIGEYIFFKSENGSTKVLDPAT